MNNVFSMPIDNQASSKSGTAQRIPIRHMDFKFDGKDLDPVFFQNTTFASAYFHALSIFLTFGEDLVIDTARHHRQFVKDEALKARVTALIGQEAIHSKLHHEFNETLAENDYPVKFYRFLAEQVFKYGFKQLPNGMQLSLMAGIEHFTAVLAEYMMKHEEIFFLSQDEKQRALWMWHMLEECEHKDIAYDVYQQLSGDYLMRISGFGLAFVTILMLVPLGGALIPFLRKPSSVFKLSFWKDARKSMDMLFTGKDSVFGGSMKHILDYLRRDFHPSDHDTSDLLAYYKEKLLNPANGLLSPFMTREFYPGAKAA